MTTDRDERMVSLLEEIRDNQREQIEQYQRMAARSVELQTQAVAYQTAIGRLYRGALVAGAVLVVAIIVVVAYLMSVLLGAM